MDRRLLTLSAVLVLGLGRVPESVAMQPEAASWRLIEAAKGSGGFQPGFTPGGDVQVLIGLFPSNAQFAESNVLVVFQGCAEDPLSSNRPILNLEDVLRGPNEVARHPAEWVDPGPRWRVCPSDSAFLLQGGEERQFSVSVDFLRAVSEGMSPRLQGEVHILSDEDLQKIDAGRDIGCQWSSIVGRRQPEAHLTVDLYYRLDANQQTFVSGGYHDIFGKPGPDVIESARLTADYVKGAASLPVDLLGFRSTLRIPGRSEDDGGKRFRRTLEQIVKRGSRLVGDSFSSHEDARVGPHPHDQDDDEDAASLAPVARPDAAQAHGPSAALGAPQAIGFGTYQLSGRFSTKWSADHSLHPGFGFRVEAWSDDFFGIWTRLASDWVQSDGTWSLTVAPTPFFFGGHLRMYYTTGNSYYEAQDINGGRYAWRDPDQFSVPFAFDAGHRYADTDGGTYNGVSEMVDAAMYTWSRLYWNGGINPVRSSPINLIAPNTGLACGGTSPWSCAGGGSIWLIAAHAAQAQVVSHELGHQLNFEYWNDNRPANAGGSHSLGSCYPGREGMTLFEGFANFLAGWVGYPGRNVAEGGFGSGRWALGWELEDRAAPPVCTNGWENEVWVARTFWDLHDTRGDGSDILWFNHLGAAPALYLNNGVANNGDYRDMRFYENIYRNAASPGHQTFISDIFDQNRQ